MREPNAEPPIGRFRDIAFHEDRSGNNEISIAYAALTFSDESRVTNLEQLERWQAVGPLLVRISVERRDMLWLLASGELRARLAMLRAELEAALAGTSLEVELG